MQAIPYQYDEAYFVGRCQPIHDGHLPLLEKAFSLAPRVVIVLGSAFQARTPKNPFTWTERRDMILAALPEEARGRVRFVPARDYYDNARWVRDVTNSSTGQRVALVGHFKDDSSNYLNLFPDWDLVRMPRTTSTDATDLRAALFAPGAMPGGLDWIGQRVPANVKQFLAAFAASSDFRRVQREYERIAADKAKWAGAPHKPIFVTADAVVRTATHVLLIQRAGSLGDGLLAVPGGYIEEDELFLPAALRELREEANLALNTSDIVRCLKGVTVFGHPGRSQRGRVITHAHYFDLGDIRQPEVHGNGTEGEVFWVPMAELASMEDRFFEDHFMILDHFLKLTC